MHHKFEGIPGDKTISDERVRKVGSNNIDLQTHKRKQVQTHMTDKVIAERLAAKVKTRNFLQYIFCSTNLILQH